MCNTIIIPALQMSTRFTWSDSIQDNSYCLIYIICVSEQFSSVTANMQHISFLQHVALSRDGDYKH